MPIYEYQCKKCSGIFELFESMKSKDEPRKCSKCGGDAKRIISLSSFQLKGSGWYVTDYKGKNPGSDSTTKDTNKAEKKDTETSSEKCQSCPANTSKDQ